MKPRSRFEKSTQLPCAVADALMAQMTESQLKCYLVVLRVTAIREPSQIRMATFLNMTGITKRQTVNSAINDLVSVGLINRRKVPGAPTVYQLVKPVPRDPWEATKP